ncbi:Uncharacterized protein TCM_010742 [Theobroma cacao]|uniref:Uncharacterized protein n=1 Tax=Theobroma cacao TaxID=3641 RepID=A0A061E767_THECC|nr:Uncharacterized protein TCM_010742 [Theobroma cacao]
MVYAQAKCKLLHYAYCIILDIIRHQQLLLLLLFHNKRVLYGQKKGRNKSFLIPDQPGSVRLTPNCPVAPLPLSKSPLGSSDMNMAWIWHLGSAPSRYTPTGSPATFTSAWGERSNCCC